jgi:hypothetical protein
MNTETIDIGELANNLSNNQICELLNRVGNRLDIYYGLHNMCCLSSEFSHATMNGPSIQINCETAYLDDLIEHEFFAYAVAKGGGNTEGQHEGCNHENEGDASDG